MIGTVIVNYKTDDWVIQYVTKELIKITAANKIVIVNNAATDQSSSKIAEGCGGSVVSDPDVINHQSEVFVLGMAENVGFSRGNNVGIEFLLKHFKLNYVLISNCDLRFVEPDVVEKLIQKMDDCPDIGLIGPRMTKPSGQRQTPIKNLNVWKKEIFPKLLYPLFAYLKHRKKAHYSMIADDIEGDYDLLNGSFFLARISAFMKAGMFDPNVFLYCEESILGTRIKRAGFRVYYYNSVNVLHEHHMTEKTLNITDITARYRYESNRYYQKEYRKINRFELMMFDVAYFVFYHVWEPLIVDSALSKLLKRYHQK